MLVLAILFVVTAAFLVAAETAIGRVSRSRVEEMAREQARQGHRPAAPDRRGPRALRERHALPAHGVRGGRHGPGDLPLRRGRHVGSAGRAVPGAADHDRRDVHRARRRPAHAGSPARRPDRPALGQVRARRGRGARPVRLAADPDRQRAHPGPRLPRGPVRQPGRAARARRPGRGRPGHRGRRGGDAALGVRARRHDRARGHGPAHGDGLDRAAQDPAPGAVAGAALRATRGSR